MCYREKSTFLSEWEWVEIDLFGGQKALFSGNWGQTEKNCYDFSAVCFRTSRIIFDIAQAGRGYLGEFSMAKG